MQYKTTIEILAEADSKTEAADISGEFLRGDLNAGAYLKKVDTVSMATSKKVKMLLALCVAIALPALCIIGNQAYYKIAMVEKKPVTSYAIQPPLRTNLTDAQGKEFKETWEKANKNRIDSLAR